jgi:hypothetical protein
VTGSDNLSLFRLLHFVRHCASPLLAERSDRRRERLYLSGNRLEAYLWLHLGVELGYFPRSESEAYVRAHEGFLLRENEELVRTIDVDVRITTLWQTALNTGEPLPAWSESSFAQTSRLTGRFQSACMLATGFARSGARPLLPFLVFGSTQEWEEVMRSGHSSDLIASAFTEPKAVGQEVNSVLIANYIETLDYIAKFDFVFPPAQHDSDDDNAQTAEVRSRAYQDSLELTRRVGLITRWRLNLWDGVQAARFDRLSSSLTQVIAEDLATGGLANEVTSVAIPRRITEIKNSWKNRGGEPFFSLRTAPAFV